MRKDVKGKSGSKANPGKLYNNEKIQQPEKLLPAWHDKATCADCFQHDSRCICMGLTVSSWGARDMRSAARVSAST